MALYPYFLALVVTIERCSSVPEKYNLESTTATRAVAVESHDPSRRQHDGEVDQG